MTDISQESVTLEELTSRISALIAPEQSLRNVWVVAETSDLRRAGHCYLELIQKHPRTGEPVARMRATIWRTALARIDADFMSSTGSRLDSGMKVRVLLPCMEIPSRLKQEGVIDLNRSLEWPDVPLRIAVISARGAAGYGDFIHQLYTNPRHLRFSTRLFPALMQGAQASASIISALEDIAMEEDEWDGVVIIRGGGATSDLAAFENYDLASNIAQFPLPVIIGIGHERDVTVLDYVANMRVKTPTAAAEWLIGRGEAALELLDSLASEIHHTASSIVGGMREQLAYIGASLPYAPIAAVESARRRLDRSLLSLTETARGRLRPENSRLDMACERLRTSTSAIIERRLSRLSSIDDLVAVLSPDATLRRGYSITRVDGHAVTSAASVPPGSTIETTLASGTLISTVIAET